MISFMPSVTALVWSSEMEYSYLREALGFISSTICGLLRGLTALNRATGKGLLQRAGRSSD